ncbi:hypothetical protein NKH77_02735 [Streptomyces sp. M19]
MTADDPREILRHRLALTGAVEDARRTGPAPLPEKNARDVPVRP